MVWMLRSIMIADDAVNEKDGRLGMMKVHVALRTMFSLPTRDD